jgi:hypothetical protein
MFKLGRTTFKIQNVEQAAKSKIFFTEKRVIFLTCNFLR